MYQEATQAGEGPTSKIELLASMVGALRIIDLELLRHSAKTEKHIGITTTELLFLHVINISPGSRLSHIANRLSIQQATSSNLLRGLVSRELIEKRPDPEDGRGVRLYLTEAGKDLVARAVNEIHSPLRDAIFDMQLEEVQTLHRLLGEFAGRVTAINAAHNTEKTKADTQSEA